MPRAIDLKIGLDSFLVPRVSVLRVVLALTFVSILAASPVQKPAAPMADGEFDRLLAAYAVGDDQAIERALPTMDTFESLRTSLGLAIVRWDREHDRHAIQLVFILDVAVVGLNHHWHNWLDVLKVGREFVMARPDPPGKKPDDDAFEIAWHQAAVALLEGVRRPDFIEDVLDVTLSKADHPQPLNGRMAAAPLETGEPRLIDPWIALTRGILEEEWTIIDPPIPNALQAHGPAAVRHFAEAAKYESTRAEALVREAWMLIRLDRPADALAALDALGDDAADAPRRYWSRLFRGRALEGLGRLDDARQAYLDTLALVPHAQAPTVALAVLALRQNRDGDAFQLASEARSGASDVADPWWLYGYGENRFFQARLIALREVARK